MMSSDNEPDQMEMFEDDLECWELNQIAADNSITDIEIGVQDELEFGEN